MSTELRNGRCLCGAVQLEVSFEHTDLGVCHCPNCQKWAGGPFMEIECGTKVIFTGKEHISTYNSSPWAERGFCKTCGTHLYIKDQNTNEYGIPPGLFENKAGIALQRQIFIDQKPTCYSFAESTKDITSDFIYQHFPHVKEDKT